MTDESNADTHSDKKQKSGCRRWVIIAGASVLLAGALLYIDHRLTAHRALQTITTQELAPGLRVDIIEQLTISNPKFEVEIKPSLAQQINDAAVKWVPGPLSYYLIKWGWVSPILTHHGSSKQTFEVTEPTSLSYVYRYTLSGPLAEMEKSDIPGTLRELKNVLRQKTDHSRSDRFAYILASPDRRYASTSKLKVDSVFHGAMLLSGAPAPVSFSWKNYGELNFSKVPARYPELDLMFIERDGKEIVSSSTMRVKNPRYVATPKDYGPAQPLPATATNGDLTMTVHRFVTDAVADWKYRQSLDGTYGSQLKEQGKTLRADIEDGEPGHTVFGLEFHQNGQRTTDWRISGSVEFSDEAGEIIKSGGMTWDQPNLQYTLFMNAATISAPMKVKLTAFQEANFPDDQYSTISLALPPLGGGTDKPDHKFSLGSHALMISEIKLEETSFPRHRSEPGPRYHVSVEYTYPTTPDQLDMAHVILESDTTSSVVLKDRNGGAFGTRAQPYRGHYWLTPEIITSNNIGDYTTATIVMSYSPVREFEIVLEPEPATVPAKPLDFHHYNAVPAP